MGGGVQYRPEGSGSTGREGLVDRRAFSGGRGPPRRSGSRGGYVTGLEPGTDYPNAKSFERDKGRVVKMAAGETYGATLVVEVQDSVRGVDAVEAEGNPTDF